MVASPNLQPGDRIVHAELGQGVILEQVRDGYLRAFFGAGERRVPEASVRRQLSRTELVLEGVQGGIDRLRRAWLAYEAFALPVMESASALTSAKIDLLPHQVVLTHRIATASPRRFLIADEVGLGKTIETALILRELASRGELDRALMVVPAGLVNNWHRELNEVFNLGFEIFGSEGDITDRKTNAFAKHDRLIASIDTLKRPARIKRLMQAPKWDLVVFDEAHHLTAYRNGSKVKKTENYKLGEALKDHSRDLILLSATPHQGNHFQFWMLAQLLNPTLFRSPEEMIDNRHRLNTIMFRRTKADACQPDGSPLFARRWVHTESFVMNGEERAFYEKLREYLEDGFNLARRQGGKGQALGFLMAIFQKIAASSFSAVRRTLKRRLLMLILHEALLRDKDLDIDGRERLIADAREMVHEDSGLPRDSIGRSEVDRIIADLKYRLVKKLDEEALEMASDPYASEYSAIHAEEAASAVVELHLPEERQRIADLLLLFPQQRETKVQKLLDGLGFLWRMNPEEKVVIFATYLGTVDLIASEINSAYPSQGVVVLRGGDHGAKVAAERRFRQKDGPRVLVCTAAGREGINLQFARILFNFDLPWNPMDVEQRIGRIHRYGQNDTAQVYNLVLSDTIEGRIYLLLDEKLTEIAKTVGKVDDQGNVAEDLRAQILGQLSEQLNYERLYQEAISDPELKRTQVELEAALSNSREARQVVFDLFQDLAGFSLDEYKPYADTSSALVRLVDFIGVSAVESDQQLLRHGQDRFTLLSSGAVEGVGFTSDRDLASSDDSLELIGLDHPMITEHLQRWRALPPEDLGVAVYSSEIDKPAILSLWYVESSLTNGEKRIYVQPIAVDESGKRLPLLEKNHAAAFRAAGGEPFLNLSKRRQIFEALVEPALQRELAHKGAADGNGSYTPELIGYIEISPQPV
ncbi:MAG: SNF2-related protein [Synechococcus sp. ELA057]